MHDITSNRNVVAVWDCYRAEIVYSLLVRMFETVVARAARVYSLKLSMTPC